MTFFEGEGLPSVAVISDVFMEAASKQDEVLGSEHMKRVWVHHPIQDRTDEEMHEKADLIFDNIVWNLLNKEKSAVTSPAKSKL